MQIPQRRLPRSILLIVFVLSVLSCGVLPSSSAQGQRFPAAPGTSRSGVDQTIPVLFVSDIHFDPFHDPGKARQLVSAPVSQWKTILASAPSPNQQQAFDSLQKQCHAKGVDTPPALLKSALAAIKAQQPDTRFMMVSGDLVVHDFSCRYETLFPNASPDEYQSFVLKTISYVAGELRGTFPGMPAYLALGNNDSGCNDYQFDTDSEFFSKTADIFSLGIQVAEQQAVKKAFAAEGNYSLPMALPMRNTRLVVLNDTVLSPKYRTCSGNHDTKGPGDEVNWFREQLLDAKRMGQRVWVMGHIPPGIDPFSTAEKFKDVCGGDDPVFFLSSTGIPDLMVEYADEIKLAVFAHTHMDEVRLLQKESGTEGANPARGVAIKMIPAISPVHGNNPSFTIAYVSPASATIRDYTVYKASNQSGDDTSWAPEYSYARAYHQQEFSPAALNVMIEKFKSDNLAVLPESENYLRSYFVGDRIKELSPFWMQYTCVLGNYTASGYAACVCHAGIQAPK